MLVNRFIAHKRGFARAISCIIAISVYVATSSRALADDGITTERKAFEVVYQPGNGVRLKGPDDFWSVRFSLETRLDIPFEAGRKLAGRITGEPFDRRIRPFLNACIFHCLFEQELEADVDEFRTDERHPARLFVMTLQRSVSYLHFDNFHFLLPAFYFGIGYTLEINPYRRGDFTASAQLEYDLLSRNNGFDEGRYVNAFGLRWRDIPLQSVGVPGTASLDVARGRVGIAGVGIAGSRDIRDIFEDNLDDLNNWDDTSVVGQIRPFERLENKWLKGFGFSMGAWFCETERHLAHRMPAPCERLTAFDHGPGGRQELFSSIKVGRGLAYFLTPGASWRIGPYELRASGGFQRFGENNDSATGLTRGRNFLIGNELFLWSPKGFLTGSADEAGSLLFGMHFERTDLDCNVGGGRNFGGAGCGVPLTQSFGSPPVTVAGAAGFNRNTILLREWDLWYFITTRMSVGVSWLWYRATNLPLAAQFNLGLKSKSSLLANPNQGKGGDWLDVNLAWRWRF
jgi:hypothetical protein